MVCITDLQLRHNLAPELLGTPTVMQPTVTSLHKAVHKVHYALLDSPSSVTLCHTSRNLLKYVTHLGLLPITNELFKMKCCWVFLSIPRNLGQYLGTYFAQ